MAVSVITQDNPVAVQCDRRLWHTRRQSGESIPGPSRVSRDASPTSAVAIRSDRPSRFSTHSRNASPSPPRRFPVRFDSPVRGRNHRRRASIAQHDRRAESVNLHGHNLVEVHGCTSRKGVIFRSPGRGDSSAIWCISRVGFPRRRSAGRSMSAALAEPAGRHPARPSWSCLFMKAYALVGAEHAPLRRSLLEFPWPRLYEHPWMNCALAIERTYQGEEGVFVGIFRAPEQQTLSQLQQAVAWYKNETLEKVGFYRMALRFSQAPTPIRRLLWWSTLNVSGYKRCKRFGTFGLSSYGALGAEQIHPISPLTTTLTYGPIDPATGRVVVKLIYDHRVLDGAYVARRLRDIEEVLNGPILDELRAATRPAPRRPSRADRRPTSSRF